MLQLRREKLKSAAALIPVKRYSPLSRMIESELKSHLTLVTGVYSAIRVALVVDFALPQVTF